MHLASLRTASRLFAQRYTPLHSMPQRKAKVVARGSPMGLTTSLAAVWDVNCDHEGADSDNETASSVSYGNGSSDQGESQSAPSTRFPPDNIDRPV